MDILLLFLLTLWALTLALERTGGLPCLPPNKLPFSASRMQHHASYTVNKQLVSLGPYLHHKLRGWYTKGIRQYYGRSESTLIFRALHLRHAVGLRLSDNTLLQCSNWASFSLISLSSSSILLFKVCSVCLCCSSSIPSNSTYNPSVLGASLYSWGYKVIFLDEDLRAVGPRFILFADMG